LVFFRFFDETDSCRLPEDDRDLEMAAEGSFEGPPLWSIEGKNPISDTSWRECFF